MTVLGAIQSGWYHVRIDAQDGWLFGAFVSPADTGFFVAQTRDGARARLLNADGQPLNIDNPSNAYVLGVTTKGSVSLYLVVLPDGTTAYVDPNVMRTL